MERSEIAKKAGIMLQTWFNQHRRFDPWSPDRKLFRDWAYKEMVDILHQIDGKTTVSSAFNEVDKIALHDASDSQGWSQDRSLQPHTPSDGSVSTDKPEDLQTVKLQNRLHIFVKDAENPTTKCSRILALLDSGAEENCVSEEVAKECGAVKKTAQGTLLTADGKSMEILGVVKLKVGWLNSGLKFQDAKTPFHVVRDLQDNVVLSEETVRRHKLRDVAASTLDPVTTMARGANVCPIKLSRRSKRAAEDELKELTQKRALNAAREETEALKRALERTQLASAVLSMNTTSTSSMSTGTTANSQASASGPTTPTTVSPSPQSNGKP